MMNKKCADIISQHIFDMLKIIMEDLKKHCLQLVDELPQNCGEDLDKRSLILNVPIMLFGYAIRTYILKSKELLDNSVSESIDVILANIKKSVLDEGTK